MKRIIAVILAAGMLLSASCALAQTTYANVIDAAGQRGITIQGRQSSGSFEENPVIAGESPTTGLAVTDDTYIPILVTLDNSPAARPQWGIAGADIVYEMPIQGDTYTRLYALFTRDHPTAFGPVRSARLFNVDLRESWDAAMVYYGSQEKEGTSVNSLIRQYKVRSSRDTLLVYNGTDGGKVYSKMFTKTKNHASPHHISADLSAIAGLVSGYHFVPRAFKFTDELPTGGTAATLIDLNFTDNQINSHYEYNAAENVYYRYTDNGPYVDMNNESAPLCYSNVIIQRSNLTFYNRNAQRPLYEQVGEGNADIFMGGRYIAGYWARNSLTERTVFFDENGNEIALQRGQSWIVMTSERLAVSYQ